MPRAKSNSKTRDTIDSDTPIRDRILHAAFTAFTERGYGETSTLEIATRARVSKRELYAVVGNKQQMLIACIATRAQRMEAPADMPAPHDHDSLIAILAAFGARVMTEVCDVDVLAVHRLAIAEAERSPEVAQALDEVGRKAAVAKLRNLIEAAQQQDLIAAGDPAQISRRYLALLWEGTLVDLLLRLAEPPSAADIKTRARNAAELLLRLYPAPEKKPAARKRA
ncbi:TetR/AcrR family transcriptional regulator [Roseiterribacter gracilis]|uniref:HTH tetR-type domain-containing protein n=1 Tax=Roseiterribacter gracilis TaxID=2812848 RepID=A0A8S8XGS3_9PROT|nr:hypothetical protein TMPK1_39710 [Rhodospirillales bacterium TMPK1]